MLPYSVSRHVSFCTECLRRLAHWAMNRLSQSSKPQGRAGVAQPMFAVLWSYNSTIVNFNQVEHRSSLLKSSINFPRSQHACRDRPRPRRKFTLSTWLAISISIIVGGLGLRYAYVQVLLGYDALRLAKWTARKDFWEICQQQKVCRQSVIGHGP